MKGGGGSSRRKRIEGKDRMGFEGERSYGRRSRRKEMVRRTRMGGKRLGSSNNCLRRPIPEADFGKDKISCLGIADTSACASACLVLYKS